MYERIDHVLSAAYDQNADTLILVAFGCGVFGNDPYTVSDMFQDLLENKYKNAFKTILFAIPIGRKPENYDAFAKIFPEEL